MLPKEPIIQPNGRSRIGARKGEPDALTIIELAWNPEGSTIAHAPREMGQSPLAPAARQGHSKCGGQSLVDHLDSPVWMLEPARQWLTVPRASEAYAMRIHALGSIFGKLVELP